MEQPKKEKKKTMGRPSIYDGETEIFSILVPKNQKAYIKSVIKAMLIPFQIPKTK